MLDKIIIILIIILIFYYLININIETFASKQYTNTNQYSWERNKIDSTLPYDIILKNINNQYYDYGNDELDEKFKKIFNINTDKIIKTIEGIEWGEWIKSENSKNKILLNNYFDKFIIYFNELLLKEKSLDLPNDDSKFKIIDEILLKYKINQNDSSILLLDIELVIYRKNKPLARHLKILVITNGIYYNIILVKTIGVINECNLNKEYGTISEIKDYQEFKPEFKYKYDMNSFIFDTNEKLVHSELEYNLYNKLLKEL